MLKNISIADSDKDMLIEGGFIKKIEPAGSCVSWDLAGDLESVDCSGKVAIPGFVNMHCHAAMALMRGVGEDIKFSEWLDKIWKLESHIDAEFVYRSARVACLEMIKSGTSTFNDQYWHFRSTMQAAKELGIRPALGYDIMDRGDKAEAEKEKEQCAALYEQYKDFPTYVLSFHAIYSVSEEMMLWAADFARKHNLRLHIHLSETRGEVENCKARHGGLTPVEYLQELGILGPNLIAAHTLWLTEHDIELLGTNRVNCVHNINSNAKICSGYRFLFNELKAAGANLCLGTDGCASSNNLDMMEAMKTASLFQKAWRDDPAALPLDEVLAMAGPNGAKALGLNTGRLEEGAIADIAIVDTGNSYFLSPAPFKANLIHSAHSDCIDSLICNGRFVMRHREVPGEEEILSEARQELKKLII
ncbi:MAG: amidohydrolase [Bacteroidales bacterium]|nr:amidohydrolase [Bacteroidales bacterium]